MKKLILQARFFKHKTFKRGINKNISDILKNKNTYGSKKSNKNYIVEFVSANPTGPMHVGHCRGAVFGDVLSNLLLFNGNKVIKEYYINDYGNQIKNFVESVYLRIREINLKKSSFIKIIYILVIILKKLLKRLSKIMKT